MTARKYLFSSLALLVFGASLSAGWRAERDFADKMRKETEANPRRAPYRLKGETVPPEPELALNIHRLDDRVAATLKQAGFSTLRQTVYWYQVERSKTPGVYDEEQLKKLDQRFADYRRYGFEPMVVIHGNAPGAN